MSGGKAWTFWPTDLTKVELRLQVTGNLYSPSGILRRMPYAVEPFGLALVPRELPPPLLKGENDCLREQPGLFHQVDYCQTDQFDYIHTIKLVPARPTGGTPLWDRHVPCASLQLELCRRLFFFGYIPFIEAKEYPEEVDLCLIEGAVANEEHLEMFHKIRKRTRSVICAKCSALAAKTKRYARFLLIRWR